MHLLKAGLMRRWQRHPCDTDLENTSLLILIKIFPPNTFMLTQDQHQYHFKLSDACCLCYTHTHTHTHRLLRGELLLQASNITTTTDNHVHKYPYRQNSAKMQLILKHWELLVTPPPHSNFSLMLCMVNCHLYANACVYCIGDV